MHPDLRTFLHQFRGVVFATLLPVVLTAFLSIPLNLGGHPGDARSVDAMANLHMT